MSRRWSLRARLTVLFTGLLALGLLAAGVVATTLLERSLVARLDEQLTQAAPRIVEAVSTGLPDSRTQDLLPSDFQPWINASEAKKQGKTELQAATETADLWRNGLADWGIAPERLQALADSVIAAVLQRQDSAMPVANVNSSQ